MVAHDRWERALADSFTAAWLASEARTNAFLPDTFRDPRARLEGVRTRRGGASAEVLGCIARTMATGHGMSEAQRSSLSRLEAGAVAVVTGQQAGLFLGPLYTVHKAASAIAWARRLEAESGRAVVPVFWLQSEDADYEEVRTTFVPGREGDLLALALEAEEDGPRRVSLAHRVLGTEIDAVLAEAEASLGGAQAEEVMAVVRRHYRAGATLAQAAGGLVAELFREAGLLVLDPRAEGVVLGAAKRVHRVSVLNARAIGQVLHARARELERAGFEVQVPIRAGLSLSCFHPEGETGPRYRLITPEAAGEAWTLAGREGDFSEEAIRDLLEQEPRRFTTTALLRPIIEDLALPTVAYVAGPGELAYWAELAPLYALMREALGAEADGELVMPMVVPRARFRLVTATARRLAEGLGVDLAELGTLRARLGHERPEVAALEARCSAARSALDEVLEEALAVAEVVADPGLAKAARRADEQARHGIDRLVERARAKALERDEGERAKVARLESLLAPRGEPQERVLCFLPFAAQVGVERFASVLVAHAEAQCEAAMRGEAAAFGVHEVAL